MALDRWNNTSPFTEEQWLEGSQQVESTVTSSPYSLHKQYRESTRTYYDNIQTGFPYVCCLTPTTPYDNATFYCSKCQTLWAYWSSEIKYLNQFPKNVKIKMID